MPELTEQDIADMKPKGNVINYDQAVKAFESTFGFWECPKCGKINSINVNNGVPASDVCKKCSWEIELNDKLVEACL